MDRLSLLSSLTYLFLLVAFICCYYAVQKVTKALRYRVIVSVIGIISAALLTWALVNDKVMDYQDANIGLGLIFFLIWTITAIAFLFSTIMIIINFYTRRKEKRN